MNIKIETKKFKDDDSGEAEELEIKKTIVGDKDGDKVREQVQTDKDKSK